MNKSTFFILVLSSCYISSPNIPERSIDDSIYNYRLYKKDRIKDLERFQEKVKVRIVHFQAEHVSKGKDDYPPSHHKFIVDLKNESNKNISGIALSVDKSGPDSEEGFGYPVSISTPKLTPGKACRYEVIGKDYSQAGFTRVIIDIAGAEALWIAEHDDIKIASSKFLGFVEDFSENPQIEVNGLPETILLNEKLAMENKENELAELCAKVEVKLISFDKGYVALNPNAYLPRYHTFEIEISNHMERDIPGLVLCVTRIGGRPSHGNTNLTPISTPELKSQTICRYKVYSWDPYYTGFDSVEVSLCVGNCKGTATNYGHHVLMQYTTEHLSSSALLTGE